MQGKSKTHYKVKSMPNIFRSLPIFHFGHPHFGETHFKCNLLTEDLNEDLSMPMIGSDITFCLMGTV